MLVWVALAQFALCLCQELKHNNFEMKKCPTGRVPTVPSMIHKPSHTCLPEKLQFCDIDIVPLTGPVSHSWLSTDEVGLLFCASFDENSICRFPYTASTGAKCTFHEMCQTGYCDPIQKCAPNPCANCRKCFPVDNVLTCFDKGPVHGEACVSNLCGIDHACAQGQCYERPIQGQPCLPSSDLHCFDVDFTCRCASGLICKPIGICDTPATANEGTACRLDEWVSQCLPGFFCAQGVKDPALGVCQPLAGTGSVCDAEWSDVSSVDFDLYFPPEDTKGGSTTDGGGATTPVPEDQDYYEDYVVVEPQRNTAARYTKDTFRSVYNTTIRLPCADVACVETGSSRVCGRKPALQECTIDRECEEHLYCSKYKSSGASDVVGTILEGGKKHCTSVQAPSRPKAGERCAMRGDLSCEAVSHPVTHESPLLICNHLSFWTAAFSQSDAREITNRYLCDPKTSHPVKSFQSLNPWACHPHAVTPCTSDEDCMWDNEFVNSRWLGYPQGICDCQQNATVGKCRWFPWWAQTLRECSSQWIQLMRANLCGEPEGVINTKRDLWINCLGAGPENDRVSATDTSVSFTAIESPNSAMQHAPIYPLLASLVVFVSVWVL